MLRNDTLGLLSLLLILGCLLCQGGIVKNGSGKRKFAVVDGERFEIPEYYISAYQWQSERMQDSSLRALKEAGTFQKWREENWKRLSKLNSSSDPELRSAFTSKWRSGVESFIEITDQRSSRSAIVWPSSINQTCPVFVIVSTDVNGFGDQTERVLYGLHIANMFQATVVIHGYKRFLPAAKLLGISLVPSAESVYREYNPRDLSLGYYDLLSLHSGVVAGTKQLQCNTAIHSSPWSCRRSFYEWCTSLVDYRGHHEIAPLLRSLNAQQTCRDQGLGVVATSNKLIIVWHIRNGDICVNCDSTAYFSRVCSTFESALKLPAGSFGTHHFSGMQILIESFQSLSDRVKTAYPAVTFMHDQKFLDSICRFLTADILITSGSSLSPIVSMFRSQTWEPVVLEEKKKYADRAPAIAHHYLGNDSAVLLSDGVPILGIEFLRNILNNHLLRRKAGVNFIDDASAFQGNAVKHHR